MNSSPLFWKCENCGWSGSTPAFKKRLTCPQCNKYGNIRLLLVDILKNPIKIINDKQQS